VAHVPNQASSYGSAGPSKKPAKVKSPAKKTAPKTSGGHGGYDWGDGRGSVHSIPVGVHRTNVLGQAYDPGVPLTGSTIAQAAQAQAAEKYAPQINAAQNLLNSAPQWVQNYIARSQAGAAASQAYAAPILANAQNFATNINQPAAGLAAGSPEAAKSAQAGQGISALAQFGLQNMQQNEGANQQYFAGQQGLAAAALPQQQAYYQQQIGQLQSQKAGAAQGYASDLRSQAVNEDIARQTLGANVANQNTDNALAAAGLAQGAADKHAARVVSRKNTRDRITAQTHNQQVAADKAAAKQAEKDAAAKTKKQATIQKAVGKAKVKIRDIQDAWARGGTVPAPTTADPNATRPATREELRHALGAKYGGQWVAIMERRRAGLSLTPAQVDYLHSQDPDFRIPREWLKGKPKPGLSRPGNAPGDASGHGQSRPT
jgi:hypothetical protein